MKKAVFLDRDGVLNRVKIVNGIPTPPSSILEVEILDGVFEAIELLKKNDFVIVVVTNQPDVARNKTTQSEVNSINSHVGRLVKLEHFYTCFHDEIDNCNCRKPLPGLIQQAERELDLDLKCSYLVGDRWRDISAGQSVGCKTLFIDYSYEEKQPSQPFTRVLSLIEAVRLILGGNENESR